jgi:hypothetical protein
MAMAHCPHCGHIFVTNVISGRRARISVHSVGTPCPRPGCGKIANLLDADYDYDFLGNAKMSSASPETIKVMKALQAALQAAVRAEGSGDSEDKIIEDLQIDSPEFAVAARGVVRRCGIGTLILALLFLLNSCSKNLTATLNWNELVDQLHVYTTGSEPYPIVQNHTEAQENNDSSAQMSRQQRRRQERQSRKQQKQGARQPSRKDG